MMQQIRTFFRRLSEIFSCTRAAHEDNESEGQSAPPTPTLLQESNQSSELESASQESITRSHQPEDPQEPAGAEAEAAENGEGSDAAVDNLTVQRNSCGSLQEILSRLPSPQPSPSPNRPVNLSLPFGQPLFEEDDFELRVDYEQVHGLGVYCVHGGNSETVSGFVRVRNLAYHKCLCAQYTRNNWATFEEVQAEYVEWYEEGRQDRFVFEIPVGEHPEPETRIEFAIRYRVNGEEFWDNNHQNNYTIELAALNRSYM